MYIFVCTTCCNTAKYWKILVTEGQQNTHLFDTIFNDQLDLPASGRQ